MFDRFIEGADKWFRTSYYCKVTQEGTFINIKQPSVININGIKWLFVFCDVISRSIIIKYNSSSTNKQNYI
jgi:hypothetical protein